MILLSSCGKSIDDTFVDDDKVEVVLSAGQASMTRTSIEDDLTTTRWSIGDEIALWATGADDGVARLSGELFTMRYYGLSYSQAEFSSSISPMDESQQYVYKAFYPYPDTISGTAITYTIASEQSGEFDGLNDFRIADEVTGKALTESTIGGCNLSFRSITHALRLTIPEGYNKLGDDVGIAQLTINLPFDATGTLSMDMANTSNIPTITSNSGRTVTLDISNNPLYAGDGRYVWLFINPASNVTGDITISANGEKSADGTDGAVTDIYTISVTDRDFTAGCVTPINTQIEEEIPYTINFVETLYSDGSNDLGETAIEMTISTTDGSEITNGASSVTMTSSTGNFSFEYTPRTNPSLASKSLAVTYESDSAIVTGENITIGELAAGLSMDVNYKLPYLFEEDFSGISGSSEYDGTNDAKDLPGLSSIWIDGSIYAWSQGNSIALRTYGFMWTNNGSIKLDLSTATNLKSGVTVKLRFNFKADWVKNKSSSMKLKISNDSNSNYSASTTSMTSNSDASFTNVTTPWELELSGCTSSTVLQWKLDGNVSTAYYDYVYIDDVMVSIVQ